MDGILEMIDRETMIFYIWEIEFGKISYTR
jgi:hypothetical protein